MLKPWSAREDNANLPYIRKKLHASSLKHHKVKRSPHEIRLKFKT